MNAEMRRFGSPAFDVIVVGSGIAGCVAALTAAPRARVAVITAGALASGSTLWAQGGIAVALGPDDSPESHRDDTLAAGRGLCNPAAVDVLVGDGPARIRDLEDWGVHFDRADDGSIALGREAAHAHRRIVHAGGDATGREIEVALTARLRNSGVTVIEHHRVIELVLDAQGRCCGVRAVDTKSGTGMTLGAGAVVLAAGGAGMLWSTTTNPDEVSGSGIALAYEAGADVESMEFMQFHPTALALPGAPHFLVSEAVRGEGAHLVNGDGRRFVSDSDERGELAPRDVVAQAIWREMATSGADSVFLDCTPVGPRVAERFPTISARLADFGIAMATQRIPVSPAAHYLIGGVATDGDGATSVPGLYACGEVASTGVHGANRLASNSLLEGVVFGRRAIDSALKTLGEMPAQPLDSSEFHVGMGVLGRTDAATATLRSALWAGAGIIRDADGLRTAQAAIDECVKESGDDLQVRGLQAAATTASLVLESAMRREESRGAHSRTDFPTTDDAWLGICVINKEKGPRYDDHAYPHD